MTTTDHSSTTEQVFNKTIMINSPASTVWNVLTKPELMNCWMSEKQLHIKTDWMPGHSITISGDWYKTGFENKGTVLAHEPTRLLSYSHLSSLSRLPNTPENYSIIAFNLLPQGDQTQLTITVSRFPTETIFKHLAFYWNVAVELIRKQVEIKAS